VTATAAPVEPAAAEPRSVRSRVLGGFAWSMVTLAVTQVWRVAGAVVLARLLTPADYGLAGMALVFSSLVMSFSDLSLGSALVQRRQITEADRSTVFWTSAGIGLLLMLGGMAVSGPLAAFYGEPRVRPLFVVVSISFLLVALQMTQASLLLREMRFRAINIRVAAAIVVGGVAGVVAAVLGLGAWALIVQQVVSSLVGVVLLWTFSSWRPRLIYSRQSLRDLGGFGLNLFGARMLVYLNRNADNVLVGRFLGAGALGAYSVAYNLMLLPLDRLILPIQDTLFPAYSAWQDDLRRLADVWLRVLRVVAAIVMPAMAGLAIVAPDFVRVVLGERWLAAVPVLQILSIVGLVQSLAALGERALTAVDRTRTIFRFTVVECVVTVSAFAVGLHWGIVGVAVCYAAVTIPLHTSFAWLTARALGLTLREVLRGFRGVALATAAMAGACWALRHLLVQAEVGAPLRLLAVIAVGAVVYAAGCALLQPEVLRELRGLRRRGA
jgi:O-antigen/teichoic acid export membrane protein